MKYLFNYILFGLILVSLQACSSNSRELSAEELQISQQLRSRFEKMEYLAYHQDTLLASVDVLNYYKENNFEPVWTKKSGLNASGREMYELIDNSRDYGLVPGMFHDQLLRKAKDTALLDAEILLTNAFFLFTTHVNAGCIDPQTKQYVWKRDSLNFDLFTELNRVIEGKSVKAIIESHQPNFKEYRQLQSGLSQFIDEYPLDTTHYSIPPFKEDSVACYAKAYEALIGHAFIDSTVSKQDSAFLVQLKYFQRRNGLKDDAIVGRWTSNALEKSNMDRFYQAALSLEKWRWKKEYPEEYIRVNIPEFTLYYVDSGEVKRTHRVIVGAYTTQTPEFHASLKQIVTNPFWHVPYSIASTEILYGVRKDSAYFEKKGFKLFKDGEQINPIEINWNDISQNSFSYKVRQDAGGGNSLGRVKFLFPNSDFIFIHDTPGKYLFNNDVRAYSHGCVRLEHPFDLAKTILQKDSDRFPPDTVDSMVTRGGQRVIELNHPFEVYLEYFTATADSSGKVIFHPDIYGRDETYIENTYKQFSPYSHSTAKSEKATEVAENAR
ncbi:MAG: L,D-transpeptidase family protein [Crocinitomicaceae bacterium]